eukprot:gene20088-22833_t
MVVLLSLSLILAGVLAYAHIPVAALPSYNTPVINVGADLPGASPETMASSVALPLEKQFSTIAGLSMITSTSTLGNTSLTLEFDASIDVNEAAVDVQAALLRAQRSLPQEMTDLPSYRKVNPADAPVLFMAMTSPSLSLSELNDYAENLVAPSLSTLPGVAQVTVNGQKRFAVRIRAKADLLNARNITLDELAAAIRAANANTPLGILDGPSQTLTIQGNAQLMKAAEFAELIVATRNGQPVRLKDVAEAEDSYQSVKTAGSYNGERSIVLLVQRQPDANTVQVVDGVRTLLPRFMAQLPASVKITLVNDRSVSIREAIHDVNLTLALTVVLVVLVIFLFLRKAAATFIPAITMPISLLGALSLLYAFGYSLDNVSLLGITLAVGLVVDDAIVVLENIVRHIEMGKKPLQAALVGSREMGFTIISISVSLVAVFIPIFFMPGVIGLLFHEFAVVVALSVLVSAVVSLTLVPMLCARLLPGEAHAAAGDDSFIGRWFEAGFTRLRNGYASTLDIALKHRYVVLALAVGTFVLTVVLYATIPKGFFPEEDLGQIRVTTEAAEDISSAALMELQNKVAQVIMADPNVQDVTSFVSGGNGGRMFLVLKPRGERAKMPQVLDSLRKATKAVPPPTTTMRLYAVFMYFLFVSHDWGAGCCGLCSFLGLERRQHGDRRSPYQATRQVAVVGRAGLFPRKHQREIRAWALEVAHAEITQALLELDAGRHGSRGVNAVVVDHVFIVDAENGAIVGQQHHFPGGGLRNIDSEANIQTEPFDRRTQAGKALAEGARGDIEKTALRALSTTSRPDSARLPRQACDSVSTGLNRPPETGPNDSISTARPTLDTADASISAKAASPPASRAAAKPVLHDMASSNAVPTHSAARRFPISFTALPHQSEPPSTVGSAAGAGISAGLSPLYRLRLAVGAHHRQRGVERVMQGTDVDGFGKIAEEHGVQRGDTDAALGAGCAH